jgi:hypothetical protein
MEYPVENIRNQFPALASGAVFFDGPGGTQVPQAVIDAVAGYYREANANEHGPFPTSRRSDAMIGGARQAVADFMNAREAAEIVFGANMTTLTLHLARALGRTLKAGDEVVVSRLDHDANIAPWLHLQETGAVIRWLEIDPADCTLKLDSLDEIINRKTRIVAVGLASNAFGTINDVPRIIAAAKKAGALSFVDAVHFAPPYVHVPRLVAHRGIGVSHALDPVFIEGVEIISSQAQLFLEKAELDACIGVVRGFRFDLVELEYERKQGRVAREILVDIVRGVRVFVQVGKPGFLGERAPDCQHLLEGFIHYREDRIE